MEKRLPPYPIGTSDPGLGEPIQVLHPRELGGLSKKPRATKKEKSSTRNGGTTGS
jgi:hypothetical protein